MNKREITLFWCITNDLELTGYGSYDLAEAIGIGLEMKSNNPKNKYVIIPYIDLSPEIMDTFKVESDDPYDIDHGIHVEGLRVYL